MVYAGGGSIGYFLGFGSPEKETPSVSIKAVNLSFAQMELVAVEEPPPPEEPEPLPPEEVDVVLEEIIEEPEPDPEPVEADAFVNQEAAAPVVAVEKNVLIAWVREQIEKEKYYPASAQRAGYEGTFNLRVKVNADGRISEALVVSGKGHPLLRRSAKKTAGVLPGRSFGQPLANVEEVSFELAFDLDPVMPRINKPRPKRTSSLWGSFFKKISWFGKKK